MIDGGSKRCLQVVVHVVPLGEGEFFTEGIIDGAERMAIFGQARFNDLIFEHLAVRKMKARHGYALFVLHIDYGTGRHRGLAYCYSYKSKKGGGKGTALFEVRPTLRQRIVAQQAVAQTMLHLLGFKHEALLRS